MVILIIIILGLVSLSRLPIDLMPDITYPTLSISTSYENASPEEIEELITRPIEAAMSAVPGVEEMSSSSSYGSSTVRITFTWGTNLDVAANDIRDRIDRVIGRLPEDTSRPMLRKFDPSSFPIITLGAYSDMDQIEMRRIIDDEVKYRIERVPGVAALDIWGGREREIHVDFYPDKIKALGLSLNQIINQIKASNTNIPGGSIEQGNLDISIRTPGEFKNLDELKNTIITTKQGASIKLGDIADIQASWAKTTRIIRINGKEGIRLSVTKQSGTNTVQVAQEVLKEVQAINQDIPQINLTPIIDTSEYIKRSITNMKRSALWGGLLAVLVLFFFLRNFLSTVIVSTAIPISIIAAFALIYFGGFTLNIMSLGGLALGIGMMVDSSIVVLENIHRLRESGGKGDKQAAIEGTEEVTAAIIAGTLTTITVFLPMIFIRGMAGVMFKQLAIIVSFALICSLFTALTLIPMLSSRIHRISKLGNNSNRQQHKIYKISERFFIRMENSYKKFLDYSLNHRKYVVIGAILLVIGSLLLIPLVGVELMPAADEGEVRVNVEMEIGTKLSLFDKKIRPIEKIVSDEVPEAKNIMTRLGGSSWGGGGGHSGQISISLKDKNQRSRSSDEVASTLRKKLSNIPGMTVRTRAGQGLFILRMGTGSGDEKVQIEIRGYDLKTAIKLTEQVKRIVEKVDGVTDVVISRDSGSPENLIIIDREKAADLNLTVSNIASSIQTILRGTTAGYYRESGKEYGILVKLYNSDKMDIDDILDLTIINSNGEPIILKNVVSVQTGTTPVKIDRKNQERIVTVSANISGRDMGHIISDIKEQLNSIAIPRDFSISFGGETEEQRKAFKELLLSLILALVLVYMVLACLYESLIDPFIVLFSVPLAIIGVILMLFFTNTTFNIQSYIGCIMLGGIVVNNAILLVDHINLLRRRDSMLLREAIEEAGRRRLRPILMTSFTTMLALIPLAIGIGEGGEAQAPLARAVIGGIFSSTLITLIFIPTVYYIAEGLLRRKK